MRKSFTINCNRNIDDFNGYREIIRNNVYQGIEIFYPYNVSDEQREFYTSQLNILKEEFPNLEFVMHLPHGPKNSLTISDDVIMNRMFDAIKYSSNYNIKKLTLHLGSVDKGVDRDLYLKKDCSLIKNMVNLCLEAKKYQMNVMIENMPGDNEFGYSPDEIFKVINIVNSLTKTNNVKFILDTGHANVSEFALKDYIYLLKDYLCHLHYNDNEGLRDEHKRIGLGNIDFFEFMKDLKEVNYQELHCMEVIFKDYHDLIDFSLDLDKYNKVKI